MTLARRTIVLLTTAGVVLAGCQSGPGTSPASDGDAAAGTAAAPAAGTAGTAGPEVGAADGVTVTGVGEVTSRPDVLRATLGVEVTDPSVSAALDTASQRAEAVIAALEEAGVAPEDIRTQEITLRRAHPEPPHEPGTEPPPEERPFLAVNQLEVRIRDVEGAGDILQAAVEAGGDAARLRHVRFDVEDDEAILADARERAFADAREKAEQYAQLADRELGDLQAVREGGTRPPGPGPVAEDVGAAPPAAPPVEPGTEQLTVHVTAVWSLR